MRDISNMYVYYYLTGLTETSKELERYVFYNLTDLGNIILGAGKIEPCDANISKMCILPPYD